MKTRRVMFILGVLALFIGCDSGDNTDKLTVDNLQGVYDLDASASMLGALTDGGQDVRSGVLDVDATSVLFTVIGVMTDSYAIVNADMVRVTEANGNTVDIQVSLTDNGNRLNLVDMSNGNALVLGRLGAGLGTELTIENLRGTYELDVANSTRIDLGDDDFVITAAELEVTDTIFIFMATGTFEGTYRITNSGTITVTEADGDVMELRVTLSENSMRLRVVDGDNHTFLLDKR